MLVGIVVIVAIVIASNIGGETKPTIATNTATTQTTAKVKATTPVAQTSFKVGDNVKLKNYNVKVNKVYTVEGDEYTKPAEGNEFLAIDCTVENTSSTEQSISSIMMFKVVDKDGRAKDISIMGITASKAGQLDGKVGAGRKMSGVYAVEVPKGTKGLELEFNASFLSSGQLVVKLN
ncbi:DUF4352 domain-containing protein [Clostridium estertheticum]|nr:DUF4352 domain-containing protein [Clostridium estertheticum]